MGSERERFFTNTLWLLSCVKYICMQHGAAYDVVHSMCQIMHNSKILHTSKECFGARRCVR